MIKNTAKRGIAMIELIFALLIMGIVLLTTPMLIQQSIQSSNVALQQESIAAIASHTGIILSKHWDEGDANLSAGVAPIITLLNPAAQSPFNLAGIGLDANVSGRTSTLSGNDINVSALGQDVLTVFDDVDDYNNNPVTLNVFAGEVSDYTTLGDYVDRDITIATTVTFASDRPNANVLIGPNINAGNQIFGNQNIAFDSNIKFIQTRLTTTNGEVELDKNITLNSFSCNLGTYSLGWSQY